MREKQVESYLVGRVERVLKGKAPKYSTPGRRAAPDRLCLWAIRNVAFVECKAPGKKPTQKQYRELRKLQAMGFLALWADTKEAVNDCIRIMQFITVE